MNRFTGIVVNLVVLSLTSILFAQMTVYGTVTDASTGDVLVGANVVVDGTNLGAAADANGAFTIDDVPDGATISASMIGYEDASAEAARIVNFALTSTTIEMSSLEVLASRADQKTPVAYTNVTKADIEIRLGSQDIPMALNTTPSVYATGQGGGAGDARINVRGFNQRNVAVMINGVPQNDMENGWVYWSNWDGVGDASQSIQMQRGLSAVNLATPSIGGTINIITDPAARKRGGLFKQEYGAGSFLKTTFGYNTGMIGDKLALSTTIVRKTGDGVIGKTWTDAWAYYFGSSYQLNENNRFELYAIGAPQRHGQNLYKQNVMAYDTVFAKEIAGYGELSAADSDEDGVSDWDEYVAKFTDESGDEAGRLFNQNWSPIDPDYNGKQYWYMYGVGGLFGDGENQDRFNPNFLNERENFFHKPLVNLNHFVTINKQMRLSSIFYWSGGSGGGTGTYGKIPTLDADGNLGDDDYKFYYGSSPWTRDWNALIAYNSGANATEYVDKSAIRHLPGQSVGILRNSINRQNTFGLISKFNYDFSNAIKLQFGVDWRTAGIEHAREVRDLLGGDFFIDYADDNSPDGKKVGLGDIIAYHNETTVDWLGFFGQGNLSWGPISTYGMLGFSQIAYTYQDHFTVANEVIESPTISTMQFKGGSMFNLPFNLSLFVNFGLVEKPPIMDNVIYFDGTVASDPANEKFQSFEAGVNFSAGIIAAKANVYMTGWRDRNLTKAVTSGQGSSGDTDVIFLTGVNQNHSGFELETSVKLIDMVRLDVAASFGSWKFADDASGTYQEDEYNDEGQVIGQTSTEYNYALKDLYVGDMPQTSLAFGTTLTPTKGFSFQALFNYYDNNYSDWSPNAREVDSDGEADREQVWMAPSYSKLDLHVYYNIPNTNMSLFAHVFNALDNVYVQDASDHSQYNSWGTKAHKAYNAEVFLGTPRYFNTGLKLNF